MKTVYRIENRMGRGMYECDTVNLYCGAASERHPMPYRDAALVAQNYEDGFLFRWGRDIRFGFTSPEQFRSWVYQQDWRDALNRDGFQMSVYEIEDDLCLLGDTQAVFIKDRARLLRVEPVA
jgi:hypothetical protein